MPELLSLACAMAESAARLLWTWSWQAAVLLGGVWLMQKAYRTQASRVRHQLWLCGLIAVAALPLWMSIATRLTLPQAPGVVLFRELKIPEAVASSAPLALPLSGIAIPPIVGNSLSSASAFWTVLFIVWLAGLILALARSGRSYMRLRRVCRAARPVSIESLSCAAESWVASARVRLRLSTEIDSPCLTGGLRRPVILLPADIANWTTASERASILRHEFAHLKRRDHYIKLFQMLLDALFFFHPLVRYASRQLNLEREMACDEAVVGAGADAFAYAESLLKVAARNIAPEAFRQPIYFASKQTLQRRIVMILNQDRVRCFSRYRPLLVMPAAFVLGVMM
ncbi:MAG: M56 family metallopeptidase [Pyrinomonadaceae bacterium]